ncbi:hypothetical protein L4174_000485 [Photobacterium sp. CCB-ST2H9]|uniref:hypothetical protein n=1 Tax=Photobacterium sp. CCB-ST2H9 TaxID=2912855 RepID=UPI00200554DD|nr:hypothetical protein [Photobacterium sp. CCB-ST2H9]UTM57408.1 hypothetical protein L4174_000485 [Photobacterium sp. CCB-ST2H9]
MRFVLFFVFFLAPTAWADCNNISCYGVGKDVVVNTYLSATGNIYIGAPSGKGKLNCQLVEGNYMTLKMNHLLYKEIYSTLLTGIAAQKHLQIRIVEGSPVCEVSYVMMSS